MGQMKRPGTQDREPRRSHQNSTGSDAAQPHDRGNAKAAREASAQHHVAAGDAPDTRQNGSSNATGGRQAQG